MIKELLQKHFKSEDIVKNFLRSAAMKDSKDSQSTLAKVEVASTDWPQSGQASSEAGPARMTAFMPWKQEQGKWPGSGEDEKAYGAMRDMETAGSSKVPQLPFTVAEISMALFKNMSDAQGMGHEHQHPTAVHPEIHSMSLSTQKSIEVPPNPYDSIGTGKGASGTEPRDLTANAAQRILDNFMSQMPPSSTTENQEGEGNGALEWVGQPPGKH